MNNRKGSSHKADEDLLAYIQAFNNTDDKAAPAPYVEIKVAGSGKEFYEKYLKDDDSFLLSIDSDIIRIHCKPRVLINLLQLDQVLYIRKIPGIYEPT
jgi:hypothetical protein